MPGTKIKNLSGLLKALRALKKRGKIIVFTNGCFDILHFGHVMYLERAKGKGDILVVGLNSDSSVKKIKGPKRPLANESDRAKTLAALACVDFVTVFKEKTPLKIIKAIKPHILVKGADWKNKDIVGKEIVEKGGGKVITVKLASGRSTTNLIKKIAQLY